MAFSIQREISDGTLTNLSLTIKYIDREHITVYVDGLVMDQVGGSTDYLWDWVNDNVISITPVVPDGIEVTLVRATELTAPYHNFDAGAAFNDATMDENFLQLMYLVQEAKEGAGASDIYNDLNMHGYNVKNLGAAVDPADAVSFEQYTADAAGAYQNRLLAEAALASATTQAGIASGHATAASTSAVSASTSANSASASATAASGSASAASASATTAAGHASSASTSANNAASSASAASSSASSASSSASAAGSSATAAQGSANAASTSASSASSSASTATTQASNAASSASSAGTSATNAANSATSAAGSASSASTSAGNASASAVAAASSATSASGYATAASDSADDAAASAASVNLPSITGQALKMLRANAGETGYEFITGFQSYGLGTTGVALGNADLNTVTDSGFYRYEVPTNGPTDTFYSPLLVVRSEDTIMQISANYDNVGFWVRTASGIGGTQNWRPWVRLVSVPDLGWFVGDINYAAVGAHALVLVGGGAIPSEGGTIAGSNLRWSNAAGGAGGTPTGTWKMLGWVANADLSGADSVSLAVRIA